MASPPSLPIPDDMSIERRTRNFALIVLLLLVAVALVLALSLARDSRNEATSAHGSATSKALNNAKSKGGTEEPSGILGHNSAFPTSASSTEVGPISTEVAATDGDTEPDGISAIESRSATSAEMETLADTSNQIDTRANSFFTLGQSPSTKVSQKPAPGDGRKASSEFFGVEAAGTSFVYIVDVSSSMAGEKFDKARQELISSIDALDTGQRFFIAFFNEAPFYQPIDRLIVARPNNKKRIKTWIMKAVPSGGTSPFEAVVRAINLRPDSIFLLSDGEFDQSQVNNIRIANSRVRVPINTIGFKTHSRTLKVIAEENQGKYRYVP